MTRTPEWVWPEPDTILHIESWFTWTKTKTGLECRAWRGEVTTHMCSRRSRRSNGISLPGESEIRQHGPDPWKIWPSRKQCTRDSCEQRDYCQNMTWSAEIFTYPLIQLLAADDKRAYKTAHNSQTAGLEEGLTLSLSSQRPKHVLANLTLVSGTFSRHLKDRSGQAAGFCAIATNTYTQPLMAAKSLMAAAEKWKLLAVAGVGMEIITRRLDDLVPLRGLLYSL